MTAAVTHKAHASRELTLMQTHNDYFNFQTGDTHHEDSGEIQLVSFFLGDEEFGADIYFKLEGQNPTGSFKDRGSALEASVAKEHGAKAIVLARFMPF